jgi:hypothetical protein
LFGDPLLASAGLDRLLHNAYVVVIGGASFRARNRNHDPALTAAAVADSQIREAPAAN